MNSDKKILITVCARGGSIGIPGKNIKELNGKPLIAYTIDVAKKFGKLHCNVDIALSTDSSEIMNVAEKYGLTTKYKRPTILGGGNIGKIEVWKDLLAYHEKDNHCQYDYIMDLDITSPLRTVQDLLDAYETLQKDPNAINIFSVSSASKNPYFNMVEQNENGYFALVKKPNLSVMARQAAPKVYDMNASFYINRRIFFEMGYKGPITERSLVYELKHICFDLDHPVDFEFLSYLITNNKLDFDL